MKHPPNPRRSTLKPIHTLFLLAWLLLASTASANQRPIALPDGTFSIHNNGSLLIDVMVNDSDPDGDTIFLSGPIDDPTHPVADHATVTKEGSQIRYEPDSDFVGTDIFRYRINDGSAFHSALVTVQVSANQRPIAMPDPSPGATLTTDWDTPILISVLDNDSDPDGDTLFLNGPIDEDPNHPLNDRATVVKQGSQILYTPFQGVSGTDTFHYRLNDGPLARAALVTVDVTDPGSPPPPPPPPSLPDCDGPGATLESVAHLLAGQPATCNGTVDYSNTFPNSYGSKCGFNIPVLGATYALIDDPTLPGPEGGSDVVDWWGKYLRGELGMRGGAWHFGGKETFSGIYEWLNENAVLAVHFHARKMAKDLGPTTSEGARYKSLADLARLWLRATFAMQAAAATERPEAIYDPYGNQYQARSLFSGNASNKIRTYIAMAGERYFHGTWNRQFRSMIFERAVQRPGASFGNLEDPGQKLLLNTIQSQWSSLGLSYGPYGLTVGTSQNPKEREALASIKTSHTLPSNFASFVSGQVAAPPFGVPNAVPWSVTTVRHYTIVGWDQGNRLTLMDSTITSGQCKVSTAGKAYFASGGPLGVNRSLYVLYPYASSSKTAGGTSSTQLDLIGEQVEATHSTYPGNSDSRLHDVATDLRDRCDINFRIETNSSGITITGPEICNLPGGSCAPGSANLLGHWDFQNGSQLGFDSSSADRHGTTAGTPQQVSGRKPGESALSLNGSSYLEIPAMGEHLDLESALTVQAWVKVPLHAQSNAFRSQQPVALFSDRFQIANYTNGPGWETVTANPSPPIGTWYHLAGVFDQGTLKIYIDGTLRGTRQVAFNTTGSAQFLTWGIGARHLGGTSADQFFVGEIDDLQVYKRALSQVEIQRAAGICP